MPRAVNGTVSRKRRKKILKMAKGYRSVRSTAFRKLVKLLSMASVMLIVTVKIESANFVDFGLPESTQQLEQKE